MPHSHGLLHYFAHDFDRTLEVETLTRTHIQLQCNGIQLFLAETTGNNRKNNRGQTTVIRSQQEKGGGVRLAYAPALQE